MDVVFEIIDQFRRSVRLTRKQYIHILDREEMFGQEERLKETIAIPNIVKESRNDSTVLCYYRYYEHTPVTKKYLVAIVKILNGEGFIITAFYTNKIKEGVTLWRT